MGILKDFFTGANLSDSKKQAFEQRVAEAAERERSRPKYKAVCRTCGESSGECDRPDVAIRSVQNYSSSRCRSGNHDVQVFQV